MYQRHSARLSKRIAITAYLQRNDDNNENGNYHRVTRPRDFENRSQSFFHTLERCVPPVSLHGVVTDQLDYILSKRSLQYNATLDAPSKCTTLAFTCGMHIRAACARF